MTYVTKNSPVQGSAHQLMLIAMALLDLRKKTYRVLQTPLAEVHDAFYFRIKLRDLVEAFEVGKHLLEHGVIEYAARSDTFAYQMQCPLLAEAEVGFTMGSMVEYHGQSLAEFLTTWRELYLKTESEGWAKLLPSAI
jgi:hypothetical protein